jgi:menaquinone-dependent protoporphyrinogen oxidase
MRILVAHASRHGATQVIATVVARVLDRAGHAVDVLPVGEVDDLTAYDAVVVGSAVYRRHWLEEATAFVRDNREVLAARPVWLFSSGPLGSTAAVVPVEVPALERAVGPQGHTVFPGALEASQLSRRERLLRSLPRTSRALPEGDFRDWDEIDRWARSLAHGVVVAARPAEDGGHGHPALHRLQHRTRRR